MFKILVVDDDPEMVSALEELLQRAGYDVITAISGKEAVEKTMSDPDIDVALIDLVMPMMDGFELITRLHDINPDIEIIMITGHGTIQTAVEAIKRGARDFIIKPFDKDVLLRKLETLKTTIQLKDRVSELQQLVSEKYGFENIISKSPVMKTVFEKARYASKSDANVFIIGETGTGKGLLAKAIHLKSHRNNNPFIPVNCGSIPKELLETELFGHKKGSFTGAVKDHPGLFVSAGNGTIFLDEIGEMPRELQVRLLRVLEEHKVRPVGATSETDVNARVIAATNHPIDELKNKTLREDLFFRLAVIVIEIPPLRKRRDDIPLLVEHFITKFNKRYSRNVESMSEDAMEALYRYNFPGNVRELENLMEGIIAVSPENKKDITLKDIKSHLIWQDSDSDSNYQVLSLEKLEIYAINQAIRESGGNKSKAAEMLGISRDTLYRKLRQLGMEES